MQALRQFHTVENGAIIIQLPATFPTNEVEVIILPKESSVNGAYEEVDEGQAAIQQFLTMETAHFTPEQHKAYERTCALLRKGRKPDDPPIFGLFEGLIEMANDFDDPLPDEIIDLFYGSETDEYGISLPR
ncbi:MAG: hypothetical protein ACOYNY_21820 [Caldilineaceae bacterium]|jgi:hypothetical protein